MQMFICGIVIGSLVTFICLKVSASKGNAVKSKNLYETAKVYLKNGWFLGALKNLHAANEIQANPSIDYAIGYASFKLEDFEEAARGFWNSTCLYLEQKKKAGWSNEYYLRDFSCDSYFMWALSEAMQDNDVSWDNCRKYCNYAVHDIDSGLLPRTVEKASAPLVELSDYETAFRILRMFSGAFCNEASTDEMSSNLKWLNRELEASPHTIDILQQFIEKCNEHGFNDTEAKDVWRSEIRPNVLSNKSGVNI